MERRHEITNGANRGNLRSRTCIVRIENNEVQLVIAARTDNVNILLTETRGTRRIATRCDAAPAICNATSEIVSGSVETGKNEFTVINFRLVRAIEFRSRNAGSSARERLKLLMTFRAAV